MNRQAFFDSLTPENKAVMIERARLGREMSRMTVEDAAVSSPASAWADHVIGATRKAFPPETASAILKIIGEAADG